MYVFGDLRIKQEKRKMQKKKREIRVTEKTTKNVREMCNVISRFRVVNYRGNYRHEIQGVRLF